MKLLNHLFVMCALSMVAYASTGYTNEISALHVENITQTSADIVWTTVHASTSQALICPDITYQPFMRVPFSADMGTLTTSHRVTITGLRPYNASYHFGTYYYYVASIDATSTMSTAPGPVDYAVPTIPSFQTLPTDTSASQSFMLFNHGPTHVFAGSDLYFQAELHQLGGSTFGAFTYIVNQTGTHNGSDGIITGLNSDTAPSANTISVNFICKENLLPAVEQSPSTPYWGCYTTAKAAPLGTFRLHTSSSTVPGPYQVAFSYINGGITVSGTYAFTVVAAPSFTPTPPSSFPAIPNQATWETQMVTLGHRWCDAPTGNSIDARNAAGFFSTSFQNQELVWFYDGGRVYQQVDDYTANVLSQPNHALWQHCSLGVLDPYRNYQIHNGGIYIIGQFSTGLEMNYLRTHHADDLPAIQAMDGFNGDYGGWVDWLALRETAYVTNNRISEEMLGQPHDPLIDVGINKLLGHLDQYVAADGQMLNSMHPFIVGLAMQVLINWYEWKASQGVYDNRIPIAIKLALDTMWTLWNPTYFTIAYSGYSLPVDDTYLHGNQSVLWTPLNGLEAPAFAWYWSKTGDATVLAHGDLLFQHMLDPSGSPSFSGKSFSQMYEWTFDYIGWRLAANYVPTNLPSQNTFVGAYPDTFPPIMGGGGYTKVTVTPASTSANIAWHSYELSTSQVAYGLTSAYGSTTTLADPSGTVTHSVTVSGLTPSTIYHYQVRSVDLAGNVANLQDFKFTTQPGTASYFPWLSRP